MFVAVGLAEMVWASIGLALAQQFNSGVWVSLAGFVSGAVVVWLGFIGALTYDGYESEEILQSERQMLAMARALGGTSSSGPSSVLVVAEPGAGFRRFCTRNRDVFTFVSVVVALAAVVLEALHI
jgi:hypothetical protein